MMASIQKIIRLLYNRNSKPEQLCKYQEKRLRELLKYAYTHSDYYARRFRECGITEANLMTKPITDFPTMSKEELIENYNQIVTVPGVTQEKLRTYDRSPEQYPELDKYHIIHSSGSTAEPTFFIYDEDAWQWAIAGIIRVLMMRPIKSVAKIVFRPRRILYSAITDGKYAGVVLVNAVSKSTFAKIENLDVNEPKERWCEHIRKFRPNILVGYPTSMKLLVELALKEETPLDIQFVMSAGEALSPGVRSYLTRMLNCNPVNLYACSESLLLGMEINEGFFLFDDMNLIEVIDGKMYLTNLYNYAQPLIRYHISDQLTLMPPLEKELPFTRCKVASGRTEDIIRFKGENGETDFLHPLLFEDFCYQGLLDYQLRQTSPAHFDLVFCVEENADIETIQNGITAEIQSILDSHKLSFVTFSVEQVEEIKPDPKTGKKRLTVSLLRETIGV